MRYRSFSLLQHVPKHRMQNPAVAVVVNLHRRINSTRRGELDRLAVVVCDFDGDLLAGFEVLGDRDVERAQAGEAEAGAGLAVFVLEGEDAHSNQVAAVNSFEAFGDDGFDAEKVNAFGGPVAAG